MIISGLPCEAIPSMPVESLDKGLPPDEPLLVSVTLLPFIVSCFAISTSCGFDS